MSSFCKLFSVSRDLLWTCVVRSVYRCIAPCFSETPVTFTVPLKDQTVQEEQSVTLECEVSKPGQKVKWFKDGKEIKPDKKRGILPKVDGTKHILTIPKSVVEDSAVYSVKIGDQETKGKLTVEGRFCCHHVQ